jgi:tetratricopeptide (TPR) repeat protein
MRYLFFFWVLLFSVPVFSQTPLPKPDALVEYRNGNYDRAVEICTAEIAEDVYSGESYIVICWALIQLSRYEEAVAFARTARNINRYDPRVAEILGEISFYEGRNGEALQYFQEYINLAPEGSRIQNVYYFMGEIYIRQGRFRHADIALSLAIHWQPGNALWLARLAYSQEKSGDYQEAASSYKKALAIDAKLFDALRGLERTSQALRR